MNKLQKATIGLVIIMVGIPTSFTHLAPIKQTRALFQLEQEEISHPLKQSTDIDSYQTDLDYEIKEEKISQPQINIVAKNYFVELPLLAQDYYYGKHTNAGVAASEINKIGELHPGDRIALIGDNIITFSLSNGYIKPSGDFLYASGVCWATTTLGYMMDTANAQFIQKYGKPLFIFNHWDRYGHQDPYSTYGKSNYGYGYAISKRPDGSSADYQFTVNPELANDTRFVNLSITIVMKSPTNHSWGYNGESIEAFLITNMDM